MRRGLPRRGNQFGKMVVVKDGCVGPVFAKLPSYNPFIGNFHHAPSAGNKGAAFFAGELISINELEQRKRFRHNPLTGTFHTLPGVIDPIFSKLVCSSFGGPIDEEDAEASECYMCSSGVPCTSRISIIPEEMEKVRQGPTSPDGSSILPKSARNSMNGSSSRKRFNSDPLIDLRIGENGNVEFGNNHNNNNRTSPKEVEHPPLIRSESIPDKAFFRNSFWSWRRSSEKPSLGKITEVGMPLSIHVKAASMMDLPEGGSSSCTPSACSSDESDPEESRPMDGTVPHQVVTKLFADSKTRRASSSSSSLELTEEELDEELANAGPDVKGFISTGRGSYRRTVSKPEASNAEKTSIPLKRKFPRLHMPRPRSLDRLSELKGKNKLLSPLLDGDMTRPSTPGDPTAPEEYSQTAPQLPANPFVARRMFDFTELRKAQGRNSDGSLSDRKGFYAENGFMDEMEMRPYFIKEEAVTKFYDILPEKGALGDGSYAIVQPAVRKSNGQPVAIKQMHKKFLTSRSEQEAVRREVELHKRINHKHFVRLYEVYETDEHLYLVLERAMHGNLRQLLNLKRRLPEPFAMRIAQQILRAVIYLHDRGVLHCDITPSNVLFSQPLASAEGSAEEEEYNIMTGDLKKKPVNVKLCDLGLARKVPDVRFYKITGDVHKVPYTGLTGTLGYIAPELMMKQSYGKPADMWSIGIILYEMVVGFTPFFPPRMCLEEKVTFDDRTKAQLSPECIDLISSLLDRDPDMRPTVKEAFSHDWFEHILM